MKNNKIWRLENMESIPVDSENKDCDVDESKIDDEEDNDEVLLG